MYCSSCGVEHAAGLSYCNRCGANLNPATVTTQVVHTGSLTVPTISLGVTMIALTLGGFALLIEGAIHLSAVLRGNDSVLAVVMFGILTILVADIMLLRLMSRMILTRLQTAQPAQAPKTIAAEPAAKQIPARPPDYVSSVTEQTTRTLSEAKR